MCNEGVKLVAMSRRTTLLTFVVGSKRYHVVMQPLQLLKCVHRRCPGDRSLANGSVRCCSLVKCFFAEDVFQDQHKSLLYKPSSSIAPLYLSDLVEGRFA